MRIPRLTQREWKILALAGLVAVVFLIVNVGPAVQGAYREREERILSLQQDIDREQRLVEDEARWLEQSAGIEANRSRLREYVFTETTAPLISARMQALVREHANAAGVEISATRLAESLPSGDWLLVEQTVSFTMDDQNATLDFLRRLNESQPWLGVSRFSMRSNRNQYSGELTVSGFSRTDTNDTAQGQ